MSLRSIHASPIETPPWFVPSLIGRRRLTLLVGQPKAGKSLAAQGLATVLASGLGGTWLGTDFGENRGGLVVCYVCAEGGLSLIHSRSLVLSSRLDEPSLDRVHVLAKRPFPRLDHQSDLDALQRKLEQLHADVLILDPMARLRVLEDENDNAATMRLAVGLRTLTEETNIATVLVHHPGRSGMQDGASGSLNGGRGASVLLGEVDCAISLRRDAKKGETHAFFEIREGPAIEPGRRLVINPATLWLDHVGDLGDTRSSTDVRPGPQTKVNLDGLRRALLPAGEWHLRTRVARALGVSETTLRSRLPDLRGLLGAELEEGKTDGQYRKARMRLVDPSGDNGEA